MKQGLLKALILGLGITFLSSGMAFASTGEIMPVKGEAQDSILLRGAGSNPGSAGATVPVLYDNEMDTPVSSAIDEELMRKQKEISEGEMKITNAQAPDAVVSDVEILNAPSADGNATDSDLASTTGVADARVLSASAQESAAAKDNDSFPMTIVYSCGALILLGTTAFVVKRKSEASRG